jgi:hypothetical protein
MSEEGGDECVRAHARKGEIEEKGAARSTGRSSGGNSPVGRGGGGGGGGDVDVQACFVPGLAYFACLPGAEVREIEEGSEEERERQREGKKERERRKRLIKRGSEREREREREKERAGMGVGGGGEGEI